MLAQENEAATSKKNCVEKLVIHTQFGFKD